MCVRYCMYDALMTKGAMLTRAGKDRQRAEKAGIEPLVLRRARFFAPCHEGRRDAHQVGDLFDLGVTPNPPRRRCDNGLAVVHDPLSPEHIKHQPSVILLQVGGKDIRKYRKRIILYKPRWKKGDAFGDVSFNLRGQGGGDQTWRGEVVLVSRSFNTV